MDQATFTESPSRVATSCGGAGVAFAGGSKAENRRLPPVWRMIVALSVPSLSLLSSRPSLLRSTPRIQSPVTQPSATAASTRPSLSTVKSLKSSRLRVPSGQVVPLVQTTPRWTGSFGVALTVTQLSPPSYVVAMNPNHAPGKDLSVARPFAPGVVEPRKKYAARSLSPAITAGKDRKSTRLNSSHSQISYAVFCLKKKIEQTME